MGMPKYLWVDLLRPNLFQGLLVLKDTFGAHPFNVGVAHVGKGGLPVGFQLALHLLDNVVNDMDLIFRNLQSVDHGLVPFHQFGGGKPHRIPSPLGVVFHNVGDGVDGPMHWPGAKVQLLRLFLLFHHLHHLFEQFADALALAG